MLKCLLYIIIYSKSSCVSQNDRYQEDQHKLVDAKLSTLRGLVGTSWWKLRKSQKVVTPSSLFYLCHTFFVISLNISTTLKSGRTRKRPASFRLVNRVQSIRPRDPAHTRIWFESKSVYTYACTLSRTVSIAARNRRGIDAGLSMWSLIRVIPFPLFLFFFHFHFPVHAGGIHPPSLIPWGNGNSDLLPFIKLFQSLTYFSVTETSIQSSTTIISESLFNYIHISQSFYSNSFVSPWILCVSSVDGRFTFSAGTARVTTKSSRF